MATTTLDRPVAGATGSPRQKWDAALQEYRAAQAAADAICGECDSAGEPLPKRLEDERERLVTLADDLHIALMKAPAPDGSALLFKLEGLLATEQGDGSESIEPWTEKYVAQTREDARRLLSGGDGASGLTDTLSRLEIVASFIRRLINSASEDLTTITESDIVKNVSNCANDALETLSIALEYVDEINPLIDSAYTAQRG